MKITTRYLEKDDYDILSKSLENDTYHGETTPEFFYSDKSVTNVYEDDAGPIMFVRGTKALRLDIQFLDNNDVRRNATAMLGGFEKFVEQVKAHGFSEIIFNSTSPMLIEFCKKRFGFVESNGELRKHL